MEDTAGETPGSGPAAHRGLRRGPLLIAVLMPLLGLLALLTWALVQSGGKPANIAVNSLFGEVEVEAGLAREFTLELLGGGSLSLPELRGQVVMVDFWSSWCPPCRAEAPTLAAVYRDFKGRGVEFVGVAIWDSEEEVRKFLERNGIAYPNSLDSKGKVAIDYGVRGIPEKFFIDRQGRVVRKFVGPVERQKLAATLTELLLR